jgi:hypothetical protein
MKTEENTDSCEVPYCTSKKCIDKNIKKGIFTNFPYNPNISSAYGSEFDWKTNQNSSNFYNRSKHTGFEGAYRENLPTSLISTMKFDYRPFRVNLEEKEKEQHEVFSVPFIGRSTYQTKFPRWGDTMVSAKEKAHTSEINVPFGGESNYKENYIKYQPNFYKKRDLLNLKNSSLNFFGKINPETSYGSTYKPIDFNQPHYFQKQKYTKYTAEGKSILEPAKFPKSNFQSLYSQSFQDFSDKKYSLANILAESGERNHGK